MAYILQEELLGAGEAATLHQQARASTVWGFAEVISTMSSAGFFLDESEVSRLEKGREASLMSQSLLAREAVDASKLTWVTKPKHHYYDELCREATRLSVNPATSWCFQDEDFIGRLVAICKACDTRRREHRTFERWILGFLIMLNSWSQDIPFEDAVDEFESDGIAPEQ